MKFSGKVMKRENDRSETKIIVVQNHREKKAIAKYSLGVTSILAWVNLIFKPGKNLDSLLPKP
jgi:hypothetical protein